jgi:peptide subunit release factor 1 (eRF1)
MERFTGVGTTDHWVVSCYLKLEPRDRSRGKYLIKLKNRIKSRLSWLDQSGIGRSEREAIERDLDRVKQHLADSTNLPTGRGIAVFACEALRLFEAVPLPEVFRSRLVVDRSPLVRELAALHDEFGLVLSVVFDRTSARFFRVTAFGIEELSGLKAGETTRAGRFHGPAAVPSHGSLAGAGEHNYHRRIEAEKERHYAEIADRLFDLYRSDSIRGIVLGSSGSTANALLPHLHPYVRKAVLGTAKLNPKDVTAAEVMESVLDVRRQSERAWETEHIRALQEGLGTGWAVNGIEQTLAALAKGQVRTLLVDPTVARVGFRCSATGRLTTLEELCAQEGAAGQLPDIVDEAIEETLRQGGHVDVIEDQNAQASLDGLGALLRFTGL